MMASSLIRCTSHRGTGGTALLVVERQAVWTRDDARPVGGSAVCFRLVNPDGDAVEHLERTVSCQRGAIDFVDTIRAPRARRSSRDLTRLPLSEDTEEIVLVAHPASPRLALDNHEAGHRVFLEWNADAPEHVLLWFRRRGRPSEPWAGGNVCRGVEPVTAAVDLGTSVSVSQNRLAAEGIRTAVELSLERGLVISHNIGVEALEVGAGRQRGPGGESAPPSDNGRPCAASAALGDLAPGTMQVLLAPTNGCVVPPSSARERLSVERKPSS